MSVYTSNTLNKKNHNEAWSKIFNFVKPNSRILDVGCSSGRLGSELIKEKNAYVVGIDIDKEDIEIAKKNLNEAYIFDLEHDDFKSLGKFDTVIFADVIEHLINPVSVLKKIKNNILPNGQLIFSVPNMANGIVRLELLAGRFEYKQWGLLDRTHLHYYDLPELEKVLGSSGYAITKLDCKIKDIPEKLIGDELSKVGLVLTKEFVAFLHKPESVIYQFIGIARPGKPKKAVDGVTKTPFDIVDKEIKKNETKIADSEKEIAQLRSDLEKAINEREYANNELKKILKSKSWRYTQKIRSTRALFKPKDQ